MSYRSIQRTVSGQAILTLTNEFTRISAASAGAHSNGGLSLDWRIKASIQKVFSLFKVGDKLNHFGTRLMNPNYMEQKVHYHINNALRHLKYLNNCGYRLSDDDIFLELGTGFAILQALTMVLLGAKKVITVDITKDIRFNECLKYASMLSDYNIKRITDKSLYTEDEIKDILDWLKKSISFDDFLQRARVTYIAPYSFSDLRPFAGTVNVCYSQVVLEHIPEHVMRKIFTESKWLLADNGYHSHIVNLTDHYRNYGIFRDNRITDVNFLRYSDKYWTWWCGNDIAYVNRLRFPFYIKFFEELGFKILEVDKQKDNHRMNELSSYSEIHDDIKSKYEKSELMNTLWVQKFHLICQKDVQTGIAPVT